MVGQDSMDATENLRIGQVTIFDTNAYRTFTSGLSMEEAQAKTRRLRQTERSRGIMALGHPIVVWELLNHLADRTDPAYDRCLCAVVALGIHAAEIEGEGTALIADAGATVCQELFHRLPAGYEQSLQNVGKIVTHIVRTAPDVADEVVGPNIKELAKGMAERERAWLEGMTKILDHFTPGGAKLVFGEGGDDEVLGRTRAYFAGDQFFETWSRYVVVTNAAEVGWKIEASHELEDKARTVRKLFKVPFLLLRALLLKLASPRPPKLASAKRRRWNFIWDSMISFSLGPGTIEGASVRFVTGDEAIVDAAQAAGYRQQIRSLDAYQADIGFC